MGKVTKLRKNTDNVKTDRISAERFIEIWQTSSSVDEVAAQTGLSRSTCSGRAVRFRKNKVPLKMFPRTGRPQKDWAALADLARSFEGNE